MNRKNAESRVEIILDKLSSLDDEIMGLEETRDNGEYMNPISKKRLITARKEYEKLQKLGVSYLVKLGYAASEDGLTSEEVDTLPHDCTFRCRIALWRLGNGEWC